MSDHDIETPPDPHVGEPLPVGAHDPDNAESEPIKPAGIPLAPDEVDEEIATLVGWLYANGAVGMGPMSRPDQAGVLDAINENILTNLTPRNTTQALLVHVQTMRKREREAAFEWADAVRVREEARDSYLHYRAIREGAIEALVALDLVSAEDVEEALALLAATVTPQPQAEPIPDAQIL